MTIKDIYQLAIKMGIKADPRGKKEVEEVLKRRKKEYEKLTDAKKETFDLESLKNPYSDTRILFGDGSVTVDKVLIGVDISPGEVALTDILNQKGEGIDLIIGHHPHGMAFAGLYEVLDLQVDMLSDYGVPVNIADALMKERIQEVKRRLYALNHFQTVDAARMMKIPFMCVHTPCDNLTFQFLTDLFKKESPRTLGDVIEILNKIPEYKEATKNKCGPTIFVGHEEGRCGKVVPAEITGGTEGAKKMYQSLAQAGVGTVISMHQSEEHRKEAKKNHLNVIVAGHMASDSIGINLFAEQLEKENITIFPCSGFIRVSRR